MLQAVINGNIESENVKSLPRANFTGAAKTELGEAQKKITATEQARTNTAYGTLATPDEVELTLPENGLRAIGYRATWKESVKEAASAAIFVNTEQVRGRTAGVGAAQVQAGAVKVTGSVTEKWTILGSGAMGLFGEQNAEGAAEINFSSEVTTGQILTSGAAWRSGSTVFAEAANQAGVCYVFAAAGTYKISVQFKASSGTVTAKNRKLWAWVIV
jgi:hypothetical protein